jgi:sulfotransferase
VPTIHFVSGLPRSGSTLLAGLLRQNPRFSAAMTGPVGSLVTTLLNAMGPQNETAVFLDETRRQAILRAVIDAYYADQADKDVVFDTNRMWCARLPLIRVLFPEAKVLCCVRNVAWIMDSFERLVRRNAFEPSRLFGTADERATVYSRTEALAHRDRVVGFAYSALKEAYYGEHSDHLLLIDYDILTSKPEACLRLVYRFLGEAWFPHKFTNVDYDAPEFDRPLGAPGLHRISGPVRHEVRQTVLPPDLFERFDHLTFWSDPRGTAAWRIAPEASTAETPPADDLDATCDTDRGRSKARD